ncbi:hypothetical protein MMC29_001989 [Sticta canariensis]|nr:hypothetical protein [Sticta canariensis]
MANDNATPNEQSIAHQHPHEASDSHPISQDSHDPRNWISAQQAIDEIEIEMNRFLSAKYSTQIVSPCGSIIEMRLFCREVAPTEVDKEFSISTEPATLVAEFYVPGTFLYTPEGMRSLRREFHLRHKSHHRRQIHPDPARTPQAQIQDIAAFKRRCPIVEVEEKTLPIDTTGWCVELMDASGEIVCIPLFPSAWREHETCT